MNLQDIIQHTYEQARLLGACPLFTGKEKTVEELVKLLKSPQGIEFCVKNSFPTMPTLRLFNVYNPEHLGVYIDAGEIELHEPTNIVLAGRTTATIHCESLSMHHITLLNGARAVINASGWAVVNTNVGRGCRIISNIKNNAIIL